MGSDSEWVIGVVLNLTGSIMINLGTNLMKLSHNINAKLDDASKTPTHRNPRWLTAMGVFIVGNILNFSSFGFAAQSMLAAMGSIQFVSNVFFGYYILKETLTRRVIFATGLILLGNTLCVSFAAHGTVSPNAEELMEYFIQTPFVVYICFVITSVGSFLYLYRREEERVAKYGPGRYTSRLLPFFYAASSGIGCSMGVLCAKSMSILLKLSFEGENQLGNPFTYAVIIALVVLIVVWMRRLNLGLKLFDAMVIIPMLQVFWTTFSIISGGIFFDEFARMSAHESALFFLGVMTVMLGVFSLAPSPESSNLRDDSNTTSLLTDLQRKRLKSRQNSNSSISSDAKIHVHHPRPSLEIPLGVLSGLPPTVEAAEYLVEIMDENYNGNDVELPHLKGMSPIEEMEEGSSISSPNSPIRPGATIVEEVDTPETKHAGIMNSIGSIFRRPSFGRKWHGAGFMRQVDDDDGGHKTGVPYSNMDHEDPFGQGHFSQPATQDLDSDHHHNPFESHTPGDYIVDITELPKSAMLDDSD